MFLFQTKIVKTGIYTYIKTGIYTCFVGGIFCYHCRNLFSELIYNVDCVLLLLLIIWFVFSLLRFRLLSGFVFCSLFSFVVYGQSDSLRQKEVTVNKQQYFDFSRVLKKLSGLSDFELNSPSDTIPVITTLKNRVLEDLKSTSGHIDLNYSYGLNTVFIDTSRSIGSIFSTSGDFSTGIFGLPVNVSFNYSTLKVPLGANNYFRISLDRDRLIEQQKEQLTASVSKIEDQQALLSKKQADLSGLMGYVEVYLDKLKRMAEKEALKRKDSLSVKYDSLNVSKPAIPDSLKNINYKQPDLNNPLDYQLYYDSVMKVYQRISSLKNMYDSISNTLASARNLITAQKTGLNTPDTGKLGFLQSIRKLDIGLTYPQKIGRAHV